MGNGSERDAELPPEVLELKAGRPRDARRAAQARRAYVLAVRELATSVSNLPPSRLNGWQERGLSVWIARRRERTKMFQLAMTVVLTLALVLGGGATTAALAQTAAPDDVLYGVKLWTEDVRMGLESNPGAKLALALQFTDRRAAEVHGVLQAEGPIPESLRARFEHQLQEMLRLASGMGDGEIVGALERVRNQARDQERLMSQLQLATEPAVQSRVRVMSMLQAQAQIAQGGIEDPNGLRAQFRAGGQNQNLNQPAVPAGGANAGGAQASDSRNPWAAATPTPGSSYGPGIPQNPWSEGTPTPGSGYGPGSATGECPGCAVSLTPGVGYGPGPGAGECTDCPAAPGGGYGSGPGN